MNEILSAIQKPWPWFVSGPLIALTMFLLLYVGKNFGMSSNLRTICSMCGGDKCAEFFRFNWRADLWNLVVVAGAIIGGFLAATYLTPDPTVALNTKTIGHLQELDFENVGSDYLPGELFSLKALASWKIWALLISGGFLVGFGARYAGGCTSGHAISGLSNLQWPSLIAVIGFFAGGLFMIHLLYPLIFS